MAVWKNNRKFAIGKQRLGIMIETNDRKLPVGIQSFEEIRKGGYLYVDKTDIIWQLANRGKKYNYLSRPRHFGKSVLVDTTVRTHISNNSSYVIASSFRARIFL